jgi:hypothetical protein
MSRPAAAAAASVVLRRPTPEELRDFKSGYLHDPFYARELNQTKPACDPGKHEWFYWGWEGSFNLDQCRHCLWVRYEGDLSTASQTIHDLWARLREK